MNKDVSLTKLVMILLNNRADEFLTYCPEFREILTKYQNKLDGLKQDLTYLYTQYNNPALTSREFADQISEISDSVIKAGLFSMRNNSSVSDYLKSLNARNLLNYLETISS